MPTKKKDKKRKGKKRAAAKRLPSAVQGLLQYLGGQDAIIQQTPRPRGATTADGGDTLSRYLAAKTEALNAMRAQHSGIALQQQLEQQYMAKREKEEAEKKIAMLSAGLKESDVEKNKAIAQQQKKIQELEGVVQQQGVEQLFQSIQKQKMEQEALGLGSYMGSLGTTPIPSRGGYSSGSVPGSNYESESFENFQPEIMEGSVGSVYMGGGGAAVEMYMEQPPTGKPIIRDKPQRQKKVKLVVTGKASPRPRAAQAGGGAAAQPVVAVKSVLSAADLRAAIAERTGTPKSKIKLPSRSKYSAVQSLLSQTTGSSADVISALKELGITLAENIQEV